MQAVIVHERGGPEVLTFAERPDPIPGEGEAVIEVAAVGVNYHDIYERSGVYRRAMPYIPGREASGTVIAVGPGVADVRVGDRVASADIVGPYAQRAVVGTDRLVPVPGSVSLDAAAAVLLQGLTGHYLARAIRPIEPGDTVLVHAAAGGTGLLLTQIIKLLGGRVIGTVSSDEKEKVAREAGADDVVRYPDFPAQVRRLTAGQGVAIVFDSVGRQTFEGSLACLRRRGTVALYGQSSGMVPPLDPYELSRRGSLVLTRPSLPDFICTAAELRARADDVFGWLARGLLKVHVGGTYRLAEAAAAHRDLEGRRTVGKLLLAPSAG
jgi:NADPH:quinone reductase